MNPLSEIKSNISVGKILAFVVTAVAVFAILDFLNLTQWVINPVSSAKAKFGKNVSG